MYVVWSNLSRNRKSLVSFYTILLAGIGVFLFSFSALSVTKEECIENLKGPIPFDLTRAEAPTEKEIQKLAEHSERENLQELSDDALYEDVSEMIKRYHQTESYLPGLSPERDARSIQDLKMDYFIPNPVSTSKLTEVLGNLDQNDLLFFEMLTKYWTNLTLEKRGNNLKFFLQYHRDAEILRELKRRWSVLVK